jgi:hypothetical protein
VPTFGKVSKAEAQLSMFRESPPTSGGRRARRELARQVARTVLSDAYGSDEPSEPITPRALSYAEQVMVSACAEYDEAYWVWCAAVKEEGITQHTEALFSVAEVAYNKAVKLIARAQEA